VDGRRNTATGSQDYGVGERSPLRKDLECGGCSNLGSGQIAGRSSARDKLHHWTSYPNLVSDSYRRTLRREYEESVRGCIVAIARTTLEVEAVARDCRNGTAGDYCSAEER
jgi:hypothetical protein